jgi:putative ABC transport system permease protein
MLKNYLKVAVRNLIRNKIYSFININGLAVGIAGCILISVFIVNELSYDKHNRNYKNIYRVVTDLFVGGQENNLSVASFPTAPTLKKDYPEVLEAARIVEWSDPFIKIEDKTFKEKALFFADNSVLKIFTFDFIAGDYNNSLGEPNTVIITDETAKKYFGKEDVVGQSILYENSIWLKVTGVVRKLPSSSHFNFDLLVSFSTLEQIIGKDLLESWHAFFKIYTYVLLPENYSPRNLVEKLPGFVKSYMADDIAKSLGRSYKISLQPLADIHLYSHRISEPGENGSIENVYIFSIIALFILLLACINFINLSTARSIRRAKEIGLRKVLGAERKQLIFQFIGESFISTLIALPLALIFAELFIPFFNSVSGKNLSVNLVSQPEFILIGLAFLIIISLAAGAYPAIFLSRDKLNSTIKGGSNITSEKSSSLIRKGLIVFQFAISIVLILCTIVVINQLNYAREKKVGIEKESVIVLSFSDENVRKKYEIFRESLLKNPSVINSSFSSYLPAKGMLRTPVKKQSANDNEKFEMTTLPIDNYFLETYELKLIEGRFFSPDFPSDTVDSYIINESAVKALGWNNPGVAIGKKLEWFGTGITITGNIIGVVRNFHFQSIHNKIEPLLIVPQNLWPLNAGFISVKSRNQNLASLIPYLEEEWEKHFPSVPYEYSFLDEDFGKFYLSEGKLGKIIGSFAILAIFIASLGLYGLAAFSAEARTKEIGIRKVLGASVLSLVTSLSLEFTKWVVIANLIAWPLAYFIMNKWLEDFAYRINIPLWSFIIAGIAALAIAVLTVSYQAVKAALTNPVRSLRYE